MIRSLWRRFDEIFVFPRPTVHQTRSLLRQRLRSTRHHGLHIDQAAARLKGLPHAAVEKATWDARRYALLVGLDAVRDEDLQRAVADARKRPW